MEKYKITFKKSVAKDLRNIPNKDIKSILTKFEELSKNPRGSRCIKLSGQARYRVRQGLYRIIYEINDDILVVHVVKVGHRSNLYRD